MSAPTPDLKEKAAAFVLALADSEASDIEAAWSGVVAVLAALDAGVSLAGAQKAIERLRKISNPPLP